MWPGFHFVQQDKHEMPHDWPELSDCFWITKIKHCFADVTYMFSIAFDYDQAKLELDGTALFNKIFIGLDGS